MEPTTSTTARDELAKVIITAYGEDAGALCPCVQDLEVADAILAAGYSKPRTITTVAEMNALPFESVITDAYGTPYVCGKHRINGTGNEWQASGTDYLQASQYVLEHGAVTVRYTPAQSA